jgi:hypothetical protein
VTTYNQGSSKPALNLNQLSCLIFYWSVFVECLLERMSVISYISLMLFHVVATPALLLAAYKPPDQFLSKMNEIIKSTGYVGTLQCIYILHVRNIFAYLHPE